MMLYTRNQFLSTQVPGVNYSEDNWRGHQTSPTVVSLKGRLPQKLQSKSTLSCGIVQIQFVSSWFYKEAEIKI